jgi:hypothetical protein
MRFRTPWIDVPMRVCFEESEMEVLLRTGERQTRVMVTPIFRLPDGTEFTGRRIGPELRQQIAKAGKLKGIR